MKTCTFEGESAALARSHPWSTSTSDEALRYLDFKASPELIRSTLEDFIPFARYPAIERFYGLIEWLNGASSKVESNDCALSAPEVEREASRMRRVSCSGRLMLLFRDLPRNVSAHDWPTFTERLHLTLEALDRPFELGMIGTTLIPVHYRSLFAQGTEAEGLQLMISFWAWGGTEQVCMTNLARLFTNLSQALRVISV